MWVGVYVCVDVRVGVGRVGRRRTGGVCECGVVVWRGVCGGVYVKRGVG